MANGFYQEGMKHWARGNVAWIADASPTAGENDAFRTALVDLTAYTVNLATHEFRDTGTISAAAQTETSGLMSLTDAAADGVCDAADVTFTSTAGADSGGILLYQDEGSAAADRLLLWWDTAAGLPVTLGGDVTVQWSASGVATI